ncbi:ring-opening amidohydrolase, partial [Rhodococcus koreensis]
MASALRLLTVVTDPAARGSCAVIGKTEGNGGVNDYTRIIADRAFREVLSAK